MNYFNIDDIRKNETLYKFFNRSIFSPPGIPIHEGKIFKKKDKLNNLVNRCGYFGPILDLAIRSTVNHLVLTEFIKDVRAVTYPETGDLFQLLKKFFFNDQVLWNGIKCWFKYDKAVEDFEINFRNFRSELCNSQLSLILLRPQNKIFSSLDRFSYGRPEILNFKSISHLEDTESAEAIFGIYGYDGESLLINEGCQGPWHDAIEFLKKSQEDINHILSEGKSKFPLPPVDFLKDDRTNISADIAEIFKAINCVDTSNIYMAKQIGQDLQNYIENIMLPSLFKLEVILLLNAFFLKSKPICDMFYGFDEASKQRVLKDSKDFYNLIAGCFMVLFYKLLYIALIKKMSLDGIENVELFLTLKDETRRNMNIPTIKQLGQKVHDDCATLFWKPEIDKRQSNMIAILKIARELGLYKDSYRTQTQDEDYPEDSKEQDDQAPIFIGYRSGPAIPKRKRYNCCEQSLASLIDHSNLGSMVKMEFPNQLSPVDDFTSQEGSLMRRSSTHLFENGNLMNDNSSEKSELEDGESKDNDADVMVQCKCGDRNCRLRASASIAQLIACSKATCTSGILIFKACRNKLCRQCYLSKFYHKSSQSKANKNISSSDWTE